MFCLFCLIFPLVFLLLLIYNFSVIWVLEIIFYYGGNVNSMKKTKTSLWILITIVAVIIITFFIVVLYFFQQEPQNKILSVSFTATDSSFSITVPTDFQFSEVQDDSYLLYLNSEIGTSIHVSSTSNSNIRDVMKYINADKNNFIANFSPISNVSDVVKSELQGLDCYNYHFNYQENKYVDVYWILKDSTFYVIDFNTDTAKQDFSEHIDDVLNSLKFN